MSRNFGGKALIIGGDTGMNRVNTTLPKRPYDSVAVGQDGPGFGCGDGGQTNPTVRLLVPADHLLSQEGFTHFQIALPHLSSA